MSDDASNALTLPPEVWGEIATYLNAAELKKLDHLGNRRLRSCLRRGVYRITYGSLNGVLQDCEWPVAMFSQFPRLKSLTISRNPFFENSGFPLLPTHLTSLPPLHKLDLSKFPTLSLDRRTQAQRFERFLSSLPRTLVWLSLPSFNMRDEYTGYLPPSLTYVAFAKTEFTSSGLGTLPASLLHLKIGEHVGNNRLEFDQVPPELQAFEIRHKHLIYPEEVIRTIPRHTIHIRLDLEMRISYSTICALPENLQILRLARGCLFDDSEGKHLSFPLTITDLEFGSLDTEQVAQEFMEHLPQGLTAFRLNDASNLKPSWLIRIPRNVTVLTLLKARLLGARAFNALPKKLQKMKITGVQAEVENWIQKLPPTVTYLGTSSKSWDNEDWIPFHETIAPPHIRHWKSTYCWYTHPYRWLNLYEKPTLARTAAQALANTNIQLVCLASLSTSFACLFAFRNMSIILPHISSAFKTIFTKSQDLILRAGVKMLHKLK